jgi:dienelactone hydrolase
MLRLSIFVLTLSLMTPVTGYAQASVKFNLRGKEQQLSLCGPKTGSPILLSSGDLGWAGLVEHVAEFLCAQGYYVVGVNSKAYLESFTGKTGALKPEEVPQDYLQLMRFAGQGKAAKVILAGISEGAGLSVLAATHQEVKPAIQGILGLGLPDQNELGWRWQDFTIWITKGVPNEPSFMVEDIIDKIGPIPLAEIHSTHDEFLPLDQAKALFARAKEPKRMWVIEAANHRFSNNRPELDRRMIEALAWIMNPK